MTLVLAAPAVHGEQTDRSRALGAFHRSDVLFYWATRISALTVLAILGGIIISLVIGAWPAMREFGFDFLTTQRWAPQIAKPVMGALGPIYGTLLTSLLAMLIAVPVGLGIAIFLTEYCPLRLRRPLQRQRLRNVLFSFLQIYFISCFGISFTLQLYSVDHSLLRCA